MFAVAIRTNSVKLRPVIVKLTGNWERKLQSFRNDSQNKTAANCLFPPRLSLWLRGKLSSWEWPKIWIIRTGLDHNTVIVAASSSNVHCSPALLKWLMPIINYNNSCFCRCRFTTTRAGARIYLSVSGVFLWKCSLFWLPPASAHGGIVVKTMHNT